MKIVSNRVSVDTVANEYIWSYQHVKHGVNRLSSKTNSTKWIGYGIYTCIADGVTTSHLFESTGTPLRQITGTPLRPVVKDWNTSLIPESEIENIRALVKAKNVKDLILLHVKYKLSKNSYCCGNDTSPVIANFIKYLDDL